MALCKNVMNGTRNGYAPSTGYLDAREAISKRLTSNEAPLTAEDIIITSG